MQLWHGKQSFLNEAVLTEAWGPQRASSFWCYSSFPPVQVFMSAASHLVVSLIISHFSSNFCIFFCLPSYQLVSPGIEILASQCLEDRITLIHLKCEHCPTFFRIILSAFRQKSLSMSSGCTANGFLKRPRKPWILPGVTGLWWVLQVLQHLRLVWRAPAFLGQASMCKEREHCRGCKSAFLCYMYTFQDCLAVCVLDINISITMFAYFV